MKALPKLTSGWKRLHFAAFMSLLLLLAIHSTGFAETVTATPNSVDLTKRDPVLLEIRKQDGTADSEQLELVKSITVGTKGALIQSRSPQGITIKPPELGAGPQAIELRADPDKVLATGSLLYEKPSGAEGAEAGRGAGLGAGLSAGERKRQEREEREDLRRERLAESIWYYVLVTGMFFAVLVPFVVAIYRGTSGSASTNNRPLGLPVGSFRSILAYSLVAYLGFYILTSILSVSYFAPPEFLLGIVATVIGFYFGSRSTEEGGADQKTGTVRGIVRQVANPARGALVKFKRSDDGTEPYSRLTDVDGRFELRGAKPGAYKISASLAGSPPSAEQEISIAEGSDHEIEIVIKDAAPVPTQNGTVLGTVRKPDGTPAPQASVVLSQAGVKKYQKATDADGKYKIDSVAVGDYDVEGSLAPHSPSDKANLKVTSGGQHTIDLKLK